MAYVKILYQDSPSTATPLNAQNLNHMDDQIALNDQRLTDLEGAHVSSFNGRTGAVTPADGDYDIGQIAPLTGAQVGQVPVVTNIGTEEAPELVFRMGAGGGAGGHEIIDSEGNTMPQESAMQFADSHVSDDSINGRTVVENVKSVASADYSSETEDGMYLIPDGEGAVIGPASDDKVEVTADGVKTVTTLLSELYAKIDFNKVKDIAYLSISDGTVFALTRRLTNELRFGASHTTGADRVVTLAIRIKELSSDCQFTQNTAQSNGNTIASNNAYQYPNGTVIALHYGNKKATVDLQTTANRCWYDSSHTVKDILKKTISGQDYQTDYAYNVWTTHTKTFTELTTIENAFISIIGGWTTSSPHEAMIVGISGNTVTYACKGMWSGGSSGINVMITAIGE